MWSVIINQIEAAIQRRNRAQRAKDIEKVRSEQAGKHGNGKREGKDLSSVSQSVRGESGFPFLPPFLPSFLPISSYDDLALSST